jgi:hypothetical protein
MSTDKECLEDPVLTAVSNDEVGINSDGRAPTDDELKTLRRIPARIPWSIYTIAFIELCERFSYYGTTAVFTNFIQCKSSLWKKNILVLTIPSQGLCHLGRQRVQITALARLVLLVSASVLRFP